MYLLFDIGGTNMRMTVSADGKILSQIKIVPTPADFNEGMQTFKKIADHISGGQKIELIAGGVAGPLDKEKTMLVASPHLRGWVQKPLKQELVKAFGLEVLLENDADLAGLGEANFGAGTGKNIVAYLTISTGVGGARIVNKKIDESSSGFEPGHQIIVIDGSLCNCGGKGHLESYVSGSGIAKVYGQKAENIKDPQVWDKIASHLAIGLNNTIVHWSPDMVILGGSIMKSLSLEKVLAYLKKDLTIFPTPPEIIPAKLEDSSGLYGALALLNQT